MKPDVVADEMDALVCRDCAQPLAAFPGRLPIGGLAARQPRMSVRWKAQAQPGRAQCGIRRGAKIA